jgi:hypothetical protein
MLGAVSSLFTMVDDIFGTLEVAAADAYAV